MLGVTQLRDVVYVVTSRSSAILRYNAMTHQRLADIVITGLSRPLDIAACELTSQLYVSENWECVWRVSSDGVDIQRWLTRSPSDTFSPHTVSVTSSRLLVTSVSDRQLRQFDAAGGDELRRVRLPGYMRPRHAVESPTGTFIVSYHNTQLAQVNWQVIEVSTEGQVLLQFSGSLCWPEHIAIERQGNVFVADSNHSRILLLDAQLVLRRIIIDEHQLNGRLPLRLWYMDHSGELLVGFNDHSVAVFDVLRR